MHIPKVGRSRSNLFLIIFIPSMAFNPCMQAAKAPTPGTTRPSASTAMRASDVTTTYNPVVANARSAYRKLADTYSRIAINESP